jgi:hypothetical protein
MMRMRTAMTSKRAARKRATRKRVREVVKVRKVASCIVVGIPKTLLARLDIEEGDMVMVEVVSRRQLTVVKE